MRVFILLLALLAAPATAQPVSLGDYPAIQTRFGVVSVAPVSDWETGLFLNGAQPPLALNRTVTILGAFARQGDDHDWLLARTHHGGNMCSYTYVLVRLSAAGVTRTEEFGPCYGKLEEVRLAPGRIEVDFSVPEIAVETERYSFDGTRLTMAQIAPDSAPVPPAGPGADVTRWLQNHSGKLFEDPAELARFGAIMSVAEMDELRSRTMVGGRAEQRGGWVFGAGCMPHQCNARAGFWGLRIADGAPVAAWLEKGAPPRWFGHADVLADPAVAAFAAERSLR